MAYFEKGVKLWYIMYLPRLALRFARFFSYEAEEWNNGVQHAYAEQAGLCGDCVPFVIPFCGDSEVTDAAAGGAVCFKNGSIVMEAPSGK